ncbi:E3 ubiquitin-protein ligase dtx3l [Tyrophagus putrescentiae]|nr:E3 ubiquitin-protein ligase dtx3l [Tyrophagus putrescentiae]
MPPSAAAGGGGGGGGGGSSAPNCPICLDSVVTRTTALSCGHVFCHDCITHWVRLHNRCPLCRTVIRRLLTQESQAGSATPVDHFEEVHVPDEMRGFVLNLGYLTVLRTPTDESLFMVQPVRLDNPLRVFYLLRVFEPANTVLLADLPLNTLFLVEENLAEVTAVLQSNGIFRIEDGLHNGAFHRHASYLEQHEPHLEDRDPAHRTPPGRPT